MEVACICSLSAFYHMTNQKYWHECRQCNSGNDVFQTLNSMGIISKYDWAIQHSVFSMLVNKKNQAIEINV